MPPAARAYRRALLSRVWDPRRIAASWWWALVAVAVGGAIWALWHLPLAFIDGSYYHALGVGSVAFWLTLLALVQLGVLCLWLANGSGGSILIAVLAHAGFNVAASLAPRSATGDVTAFVAITAATVAVVVATRGRLRYAASG